MKNEADFRFGSHRRAINPLTTGCFACELRTWHSPSPPSPPAPVCSHASNRLACPRWAGACPSAPMAARACPRAALSANQRRRHALVGVSSRRSCWGWFIPVCSRSARAHGRRVGTRTPTRTLPKHTHAHARALQTHGGFC